MKKNLICTCGNWGYCELCKLNNQIKTILLTGSCGFIFANFVRKAYIEKWPYRIVGVDKIVQPYNLKNINKDMNPNFYIGDIANRDFMENVFRIEKPDYVINGAAESFVDHSIASAIPFVHSNIMGTQVMIDLSVKYKVDKFIQISCYDENTKAVTKNGLKHYSELKEGDTVLTINPNTNIVEEKKINKVIVQDYDGDILYFKNRRVDFAVTPNHRCLSVNEPTNNNIKINWNTAEDFINEKTNKYLPSGEINKKSVKTIHLSEIGDVDAEALFYVCGVFIGDGFTAYQERTVKNKSGYSKKELNSNPKFKNEKGHPLNSLEIINKYGKGPNEYTILRSWRIFFDVPENDKARKLLELSLNKLNIKWYAQKNKSGEHIYFTSEAWLKFFETFGKYAKNKQIPEWMFEHGKKLLKKIWKGIHDADGHGYNKPKRNIRITTISEKLTSQLCYLGSMIGYQTKIDNRYNESYIDGRKISGWCNIIYFSKTIRPLIPKPIIQKYTGKIWCLSVADNKNFLVERNGKIIYSGNTDEVYGQLSSDQDEPWTEECCISPRNPYSATKGASELLVKAAIETHKLPAMITRCSNNFGPRQPVRNLIPVVIDALMKNKEIPIHGKGNNFREWIFVEDHNSAVMTVLEKGTIGEVYNIGSGVEKTNLEIVNEISALMKTTPKIKFVEDRKGHDFRYSVNCSKIKKLSWAPQTSFEDGMKKTISWYVENPNFYA